MGFVTRTRISEYSLAVADLECSIVLRNSIAYTSLQQHKKTTTGSRVKP
jgi:hypothetical protein